MTRLIARCAQQPRDCGSRGSRWPPRPATAGIAAILEGFAHDTKLPVEARVAAVEAIGSFDITPNRVPEQLVAAVRGKPSSDPVAEAAVRAMARHSGARGRLTDIVTARDYPLGLRREALRGLAELQDGGHRVHRAGQGRQAARRPQDRRDDAALRLAGRGASARRRPGCCRCRRWPAADRCRRSAS